MNMTIMWLILAIILFIIEAVTINMVCIWFGIAAVASMLSTYVTSNIYIQWLVFIVTAIFSLLLFRPIAKKAVTSPKERTNSLSLIGRTARLTEEITEHKRGRLTVGDISWTAVSSTGEHIAKGEKVKIISISGNKLVVERI